MNLSFRTRVTLLVLGGFVVGLSLFGWLANRTLRHNSEDLLKERLSLVYVSANNLDITLRSFNMLLNTAVNFEAGIPSEEQFILAEKQIYTAFAKYGIEPVDMDIVDRRGNVVRDTPGEPEHFAGTSLEVYDYNAIREALTKGSYVVSDLLWHPISGAPAVLIVSPIFNADDTVAGAVVVAIDVKQLRLLLFNTSMPGIFPNIDGRGGALGKTGYFELVDAKGFVLDRTPPAPPVGKGEKSAHGDLFVKLIDERAAKVISLSGHESIEPLDWVDHVLAFAPLSTVNWGIAIEQSTAEVLDAAWKFERQILIYGFTFAVVSLVLTWLFAKRTIKPISLLAEASNRLGRGDFDIKVPVRSHDEIGQLATAFNTMTTRLSKAQNTLSMLYQSEKEKDEMRGRLLHNVVIAQEEERKKIARELHDELSQTVTGLIMRLEAIEKTPVVQQLVFKEDLAGAKEMAIRLLGDIRELTSAFRPCELDVLGLLPAIHSFVESRLGSKVKFELYTSGMDQPLPPVLESQLFRIAQEAIRNVEKYASAENVYISLETVGDKVQLIVEDDGKGFNLEEEFKTAGGQKHFGLIGIRERAEFLGGDAKLESESGRGTRITITVPLVSTPCSAGHAKLEQTL